MSRFLTPEDVSVRWRGVITPATLANWRSQKTGPSFMKAGNKILYPIESIERWEEENATIIKGKKK